MPRPAEGSADSMRDAGRPWRDCKVVAGVSARMPIRGKSQDGSETERCHRRPANDERSADEHGQRGGIRNADWWLGPGFRIAGQVMLQVVGNCCTGVEWALMRYKRVPIGGMVGR